MKVLLDILRDHINYRIKEATEDKVEINIIATLIRNINTDTL